MTTNAKQIYTVTMPDIGEGVVEGEVTAWLKNVGNNLAQDEPIVELMTDKATVELPTPYPGTLVKQYYKVGDIAIKGKPLYDVEVSGEVHIKPASPPKQEQPATTAAGPAVSKLHPAPVMPVHERKEGVKALATPPVRKIARELGIDIDRIQGSGKEGRVTEKDLQAFAGKSSKTAFPPLKLEGDEVQPLIGIRRLVAKRMSESKRHIPHFGFCDKADVTLLIKFRDKNKEEAGRQGFHLSFMPLFIRALSLTLNSYPQINASVDEENGTIVIHKVHNIGIAMKTPQGLIVPVLKHVEAMTFQDTVRRYDELRKRAVNGSLKPEDMRESTITLSNFGTEGGLWASPVINYPEAAILATAKIQKQAVVKGDSVVIRDILNCSWAFDHRIIDGDLAAAVSNHFIKLLENPGMLL